MQKKFQAKILYCVAILIFSFMMQITCASQPSSPTLLLKEMFSKVVLAKNAKLIPLYYHQDFELHSNGKMMTFNQFLALHQEVYNTSIQYKIRYDEQTFVEQHNKVAGKLFITTQSPHESAREIEVILIAEYKENKLYRLWELTYPDWSKMKSFEKASAK